ncbi:hypothetical protein F357_gp29 [Haemophilus phage SuMu]|uniref:hypothetical protein n=1 Tax=Haemophilus phage SuMu TaxID=483266 RepID=UPI0002118FD8|nr:hypothetical protein F357_gp29 [Haemophilus phage SuMu]ABX51978.2 hypothetical protein SuMu_29 [Haemophilus phage SuMu]
MEELLGDGWESDYPKSLTQEDKEKLKQALMRRLEQNADDAHHSALCSYLRAFRIVCDYPLSSHREE